MIWLRASCRSVASWSSRKRTRIGSSIGLRRGTRCSTAPDGWVRAASVRKATHTSGQGVVVGIVDTGVELTHPDLRTADDKTRVAWLFDASVGRAPAASRARDRVRL